MGLFGSPKDRFARQVLRTVRATGRVSSAAYDADAFSIVYQIAGDETGSGRIYLENTYRETSDTGPRERAQRIERLVAAVVGSHAHKDSWEQARPKLRPVLRGVSFGAEMVGDRIALVNRPALPFLMEAVVVDEPTSMAYVSRSRLGEWGVTEEEVFANARANVASAAQAINASGSRQRTSLLRFVDSGDAYFTSMLLIEGFLARLALVAGGRPVAFVPDRDNLLVTSEGADLSEIYPMVEREYRDATRSISPVGYTVDDRGLVVPYAPPTGSALASLAHRAEVLLAAAEYAGQKAALDAAHERDGLDVFVGSLIVAERPGAPLFSIAVWSQDVDTLLPHADLVGFQPAETEAGATPLTVPFDVVVREAVLLPEPDYAPPRFRVRAWPDEPVMALLRSQAVAL